MAQWFSLSLKPLEDLKVGHLSRDMAEAGFDPGCLCSVLSAAESLIYSPGEISSCFSHDRAARYS